MALADVFIQWKGTDVCLDFHCSCQPADEAYEGHYDGYFAYHLRCKHCGAVYTMPTGFQLQHGVVDDANTVTPVERDEPS